MHSNSVEYVNTKHDILTLLFVLFGFPTKEKIKNEIKKENH